MVESSPRAAKPIRMLRRRTKSWPRARIMTIPLANDLWRPFQCLCVLSIRLPSDRRSSCSRLRQPFWTCLNWSACTYSIHRRDRPSDDDMRDEESTCLRRCRRPNTRHLCPLLIHCLQSFFLLRLPPVNGRFILSGSGSQDCVHNVPCDGALVCVAYPTKDNS